MFPAPGSSVPGRGAWSKVGKDNRSPYYRWTLFIPRDGMAPTVSFNHYAVHLGIRAIQELLIRAGEPVTVNGVFGPTMRNAVKRYQAAKGLGVDGVVGPATAGRMAHAIIETIARDHSVPPEHVWGMTDLESGFDPGAVGVNGFDCSWCQINLNPAGGHGGSITVEQAFDPAFAIGYTCSRLASARGMFTGKGPELQRDCSIVQHNSPLAARQWWDSGVAPNEKAATYVRLVLARAEKW